MCCLYRVGLTLCKQYENTKVQRRGYKRKKRKKKLCVRVLFLSFFLFMGGGMSRSNCLISYVIRMGYCDWLLRFRGGPSW